MALATTTKVPLLPRAMWLLAGAVLASSGIFVFGELADGSDDATVVPAPQTAPVDIEDDPLFTRYGESAPSTDVDVEDDPLVVRYGDR